MQEIRRLAVLAWPVIIAQLGFVGMGTVDLFMVAPLGADATAAVGIGNTLSFGVLIFGLGAASGLDPLVAQAYGAGRPRDAGAAALHGAALVLALSIPITLFHWIGSPLLRALGQPESVIPHAVDYLWITGFSVVPALGFAVVRQLLQGGGSMRPAMWVIGLGNVVNLVADAMLVRGFGPIPAYGVVGVAWATTVVRFVMFGALLWLGAKELSAARPEANRLRAADLRRVAGIALPVAFSWSLEVWAFNAGFVIAGILGARESAAHAVAMNLASISFMVPLGISAAAATRVGNLVGAGEDWRRAGWASVTFGAGAMTFSALTFVLFPRVLGAWYTSDPEVVLLIAAVLPIAAAFQWFDGTQVVSFGVLRGLGDTRRPAIFNLVGYWVVGIPVGAWLALREGFGLRGVWYGLSSGLGVVAVLLVLRLGWHSRRVARVVTLDAKASNSGPVRDDPALSEDR